MSIIERIPINTLGTRYSISIEFRILLVAVEGEVELEGEEEVKEEDRLDGFDGFGFGFGFDDG